jgi:uncharacterized protein (DUF885 family)
MAVLGPLAAIIMLTRGQPSWADGGLPQTAFANFAEEYVSATAAFAPVWATQQGFHAFDGKLDNLSADAVAARVAQLHALQARLTMLSMNTPLSEDDAIDAEIIDGQIHAELLNLETLRLWRRNPTMYVSLAGAGIDALIKRDFASPPERLRAVIERMRQIPSLLAAMRANTENPPHEFTESALAVARGCVEFYRRSVPEWAAAAAEGDTGLLNRFSAVHHLALRALQQSLTWLARDLLPQSRGSFALGVENFVKKLRYEDMIDTPLDDLLTRAEHTLRRDRDHLTRTAREIDANKTVRQVVQLIAADHPSAAGLIPAAAYWVDEARRFVIERRIVTLPSNRRPITKATPPYARDETWALLDVAGPFEARAAAAAAFYYITPPERHWSRRRREEHLRAFNRPALALTAIHETFPGHFVQSLYDAAPKTLIRKLAGAATTVEGWAHYAEEMMLDEGFAAGDPTLRLGQLLDALLRDCRFITAIRLHTRGMTVQQAARLFEDSCFQNPSHAREEARRGTSDPMFLAYTLGKLEIMRLRDDYKHRMGAAYSLTTFHDELLRHGGVPLPVLRRLLLR